MKFEWAMKQLRAGNRVRRPTWMPGTYWALGIDECIVCSSKGKVATIAHIHLNQLEADDFEAEKKEPEKLECNRCKATIKEGQKFCGQCGAELLWCLFG